MGLFGSIFGKRGAVHCARCNNTVKESDLRGHDGKVYCASCYNRILEEQKRRSGARAATASAANTVKNDTGHDDAKCPASIQEILDAFKTKNIKYRVNHYGDQWEVVAPISGEHNQYEIKFLCKESGGSLALRVFSLAHIDKDKHERFYPLLNQMQETYRFLRFTLDADDNIKLEYDFPPLTTDIGDVALELLLRTMTIVNDAYPILMKRAWS